MIMSILLFVVSFKFFFISFFLSLASSAHSSQVLHLIKLSDTQLVGLLWTTNQPVSQTSI